MKNKIIFCVVNDIHTYADDSIKSTIQNILDFTLSNLYVKGYKAIVNVDEDEILQLAKDYDYAVVMSPGTEFINGVEFFNSLEKLIEKDFFIAGHILDRSLYHAYYELHHQCYVVNMMYYKFLNCPTVGKLSKNSPHSQIVPIKSIENWHDDYTPKIVSKGTRIQEYHHKCHGWNLLKHAFENNLNVLVFDESIRNNKKHYYPESKEDYDKNASYIDQKFNYCKKEFVHTDNTEWANEINGTYNQIAIPASGTLYLNLIEKGNVIFFDYNQRSLDYWMENCIRKQGINYKFVKTDLLNDLVLIDHLDPDLKTLVNLSNIFCYEGTAAKYSLKHRLTAQNNLVSALKNKVKDININFTIRADDGH